METDKIINLLEKKCCKYLLQKMVCYRSQIAKGKYNQNNSIKLETETIKSNLYDYSDVFILVTGDTMIQMLHLNIVW